MIKTLRITSIVVGLVATVLLVLSAFFGVHGDEEIENLLKSAGAADKFLAEKGKRPARDESQTSPLVQAAAAYALILNPPPPPPPKAPPPSERITSTQPAPPVPVTPKFNLVGTSYYAGRPELSLALIDEPGKGLNWVRQGSTVGHLTIEQIKDGSIIIKSGQSTSEMNVTVSQPWRSLLKNPPPETKPSSGTISAAPSPPAQAPTASPATGRARPGFGPKMPLPQTSVPKIDEQLVTLPAEAPQNTEQGAENLDIDVTSPEIEAQQAKLEQFMSEMSDEPKEGEIEKLSELTQKLEELKAAELMARQQQKPPAQTTEENAAKDANQ